MIELKGINKFFPSNGVFALEAADFTLMSGEIHALLGENGAGKSTLMHILAGYTAPGSGTIIVDGKERRFKTPADALAAGVGMVRQHPHSVKGFKVWEDCILGAEKPKARAAEVSGRWGFDLPLDAPAESLSVSQRQKAAILALILRDVRYLIFDEPAAVLSPAEKDALFNLIRRLKDAGKGIVLISHKLDETLELADRITVIRQGKTTESREAKSLSSSELEKLIFGIELISQRRKGASNFRLADTEGDNESGDFSVSSVPLCLHERTSAETVLSVQNLSIEVPGKPFIKNLNLELTAGKILGIAGMLDSGLETLELALTGFLNEHISISETIRINGHTVNSVRSFREAGGAYLGADRLGKNLVPSLPLKESLMIHAHRRSRYDQRQSWRQQLMGKFGIMNKNFLDSSYAKIMNRAEINRSVKYRADSFSGGMLQRILLAREFEEDPSLFVLSGGSWGLDQQNRRKFTEQLRSFVKTGEGRAALLFSTDPDELLGMADEILVLRNGNFSARISVAKRTVFAAHEIRRAMLGANSEKAAQA